MLPVVLRRSAAAYTGTDASVLVVLALGLSLLVNGPFVMPVMYVERQGRVRLSSGHAFGSRSKGWKD